MASIGRLGDMRGEVRLRLRTLQAAFVRAWLDIHNLLWVVLEVCRGLKTHLLEQRTGRPMLVLCSADVGHLSDIGQLCRAILLAQHTRLTDGIALIFVALLPLGVATGNFRHGCARRVFILLFQVAGEHLSLEGQELVTLMA